MKLLVKAKSYLAKEKFEIFREIFISIIFSAIVSAIVTILITSYFDLRNTRRQFIYDFGRTFFDNPKYRKVSIAIEEQYLYGKEDRISSITEYEIDDYLGLISDMWTYYQDGFISKELIDDQYSYYLCITYNSKLIKDYRKKLQQQGFSNIESYGFLDKIAQALTLKGKNCKELQ